MGKAETLPMQYDPEKELAQVDEWAGFTGEDDGTETITPTFPVVQVVQATSKMPGAGKHGGEFWHSDAETYERTLNIVALLRRETRALFGNNSDIPLCRSSDGVVPAPRQPLWTMTSFNDRTSTSWTVPPSVPETCAACPFSQWEEGADPPPCRNSDEFLVIREDGTLARFRATGTSIRPFRRFIARKARPRNLPLCAFRLHLTTVEKSEPSKKWYELVVEGDLLPRAEAEQYLAMLRAYRGEFEREVQEHVVVDVTTEKKDDWE